MGEEFSPRRVTIDNKTKVFDAASRSNAAKGEQADLKKNQD